MKKILFLNVCLFLFSAFSIINAQDLILKKNGEELKIKVLEINTTQIIFKYSDNLEGPQYVIEKAEVFMIRYGNGSKEIIASDEPIAKKQNEGRV